MFPVEKREGEEEEEEEVHFSFLFVPFLVLVNLYNMWKKNVMVTNVMKKKPKTSKVFVFFFLYRFYFTIMILLPLIVMSEKKMIGYECHMYI